MSVLFEEKTWPQIEQAIKDEAVVLLPLGQTEQHGTHLQTGCDTFIADRTARAVAESLKNEFPVLVLPAIAYGYVPKSVQQWPGVFRIRWDIMVGFIADVCTSVIEMGFKKLVIISTHGPHNDVAILASREVFDRTGVGIVITFPHKIVAEQFKKIRKSEIGGENHAGEYETSLCMHFGYPVDVSKTDARDMIKVRNEWVAGDLLNASGKVFWSTWALQISQSGTYGDPSKASAETGKATFEAIVREYSRLLRFVRAHQMPAQQFPTYPRNW